MSNTTHRLRFAALIAAAALVFTGCASTSGNSAPEKTTSASSEAAPLTITDAWVKAKDSGMSAAFGDLKNSSSKDITVVSATTEVSSKLELHETVENAAGEHVMQEVKNGFVIPAGKSFKLQPGGNHIMLMDLKKPLVAGDEVTFKLKLSDDSTFDFTAPVKDYSGANENYKGDDKHDGMNHDGHEGMNHDAPSGDHTGGAGHS